MADKAFNIFINQEIYPDAKSLFSVSSKRAADIKDDCLFVLDTNALLIPYGVSSDGLEKIGRILSELSNSNRLVIPAQVAREFVKNRPERLKELYSSIKSHKEAANGLKKLEAYPILEELEATTTARELHDKINKLLIKFRDEIDKMMDQIELWGSEDPVSVLYREVFSADVVIELQASQKDIAEDLSRRATHFIPPGYQDKNKPDAGIGDLLIWLTILQVAKQGRNVIFVSHDRKGDWFYKSEKKALFPRFELIAEFSRSTNGHSFDIIQLSDLLEMFKVDQKVLQDVRQEEYQALLGESASTFSFSNVPNSHEFDVIRSFVLQEFKKVVRVDTQERDCISFIIDDLIYCGLVMNVDNFEVVSAKIRLRSFYEIHGLSASFKIVFLTSYREPFPGNTMVEWILREGIEGLGNNWTIYHGTIKGDNYIKNAEVGN